MNLSNCPLFAQSGRVLIIHYLPRVGVYACGSHVTNEWWQENDAEEALAYKKHVLEIFKKEFKTATLGEIELRVVKK